MARGQESPASAGGIGDVGFTPGWGRAPRTQSDNPLQYSCLRNPMDRGARQAAVHGLTKSQTRLSMYMHVSANMDQESNPRTGCWERREAWRVHPTSGRQQWLGSQLCRGVPQVARWPEGTFASFIRTDALSTKQSDATRTFLEI